MRILLSIAIIATVSAIAPLAIQRAAGADDLIDYLKLDHDITAEIIRGGNHDPSGDNEYYFKVDAYALLITKSEVDLPLEKRKKIHISAGEFGDYKVKPLDFWRREKKSQDGESSDSIVTITGDQIRNLVSQAMVTFRTQEAKIAIHVTITMLERNKQFGFYGEDTTIGSAKYDVIPETLPRRPVTDNLTLQISDNKGTSVALSVIFLQNTKSNK